MAQTGKSKLRHKHAAHEGPNTESQRERLDKKIQETRRGDKSKPNTNNQILITQNLNPQSINSHNMITNQTTKL